MKTIDRVKSTRRGVLSVLAPLTLIAALALTGCNNSASSGGGSGTTASTDGNAGGASPMASGGSGAPAGGKTLEIALIPKGTSHEYWKSIHAGGLKAKEDLAAKGTNIDLIWKGTESEGDRNGQVNLVETFVTKKVDGIVLAPLDNQALMTPVHDATSHKIPVVIIDSSLNGTDWSSFDATDNEKGGELAGDQLGKLLGGKGNVLMLAYAQGSASTEDREKGFLTAIKKFPGITVLSANQYGGPTSDTAYKASQNLLARYKTQVNGVFASNESNTIGMHQALKDANLLHTVKFVGFDTAPKLLDALKADELQGLVAQDPFKMGETGVNTAVAVIQGKPVEKKIDTGVALLTKDNMDKPEFAEFVHPPLDKYLQ